MQYLVIVKDGQELCPECQALDCPQSNQGIWVLATRRVFDDKELAQKYANTCSPSRDPSLVEVMKPITLERA